MTRPGSPGTAADRFRVVPPTVPAPREHADATEPGRRTHQPRHQHEEKRNA